MTNPVDWRATQAALKVAADGLPGDQTWLAILRVVASPKALPADLLAMARALKAFGASLGGLTTAARIAAFVSNCANESGGFSVWVENLNYSAARMAAVWPGRYADANGKPNAKALKLAGDPVAFANDVYGARMGNERDGIADNDGFDYRGLGPLQTTGFDNFAACERDTGVPFTAQPALMKHPGTGTIGALSWWRRSGCNAQVDAGSPKRARSIANAGNPNVSEPEGWSRVSAYHNKLMEKLK